MFIKVTKLEELSEAITAHCLNAAEKIRLEKQTVKKITVFIRTSPFQNKKKYYVALESNCVGYWFPT